MTIRGGEPGSKRIYTFYSYKGGVGRSMALANIAVLLADQGYRVLVVDWDLEAPGIQQFFSDQLSKQRTRLRSDRLPGVVDLVEAQRANRALDWTDCLLEVSVRSSGPPVSIITAGQRDEHYVQRLQQLDWGTLFVQSDLGTYLERLRHEWVESFDYVLVDSRTGITDIGGICTIYLPDVLIVLLAANQQSLDGVVDVVRRARLARDELPFDRGRLVVVPVLARDESRNEYEQAHRWRASFAEALVDLYSEFLPRGTTPEDALEQLRIPNIPYWSFGERLAVLRESGQDPDTISFAYSFLTRLIGSALDWTAATSAPPRAVAAPTQGGARSGQLRAEPELDDLEARLAAAVRAQWEAAADAWQLRDPQPMSLRLSAADATLMDHPDVILPHDPSLPAGRPLLRSARIDDIVQVLDALPRRRLVVIGLPGAGKTTVLVLLTLGLLHEWWPPKPVPVLITVSSWDPQREPFLEWLPRHLGDEYTFLRGAGARALVAGGRILPVLDGLDELPTRQLGAALQAINVAWVELPLVASCRSAEYAAAVHLSRSLTGAAVAELEAIRPEDASAYLRRSTPQDDRLARWEPVFVHLRGKDPSDPVALALSTPLMVVLARTIYATDRSSNPAELVDRRRFPTVEAIEDHLLDALVPSVFAVSAAQPRTDVRRWDPRRAEAWLAGLARHLWRRGTHNLAWWELAPRIQLPFMVAIAAWFGFLGGIAGWACGGYLTGAGPAAAVTGALRFGMLIGLPIGLVVGLMGTAGPAQFLSRPARVAGFGLRRTVQGLWVWALAGLGVGLVTSVVVTVPITGLRIPATPTFAVLLGLIGVTMGSGLGLGVGLAQGLVKESDQSAAPVAALWSDRTATVFTLASTGLVLGVASGLLFGRLGGLPLGLEYGMGTGLAAGLSASALRPWPRYQLARARLALQGRLPWTLMRFLQDARELGILRQVGSVYQFRHARLLDRLSRD